MYASGHFFVGEILQLWYLISCTSAIKDQICQGKKRGGRIGSVLDDKFCNILVPRNNACDIG